MNIIRLVKELPLAEQSAKSCVFCTRKEDDELLYGKFYTNGQLTTHYLCLLFTSGVYQKAKDDEEFLGFSITDILEEVKRGRQLKCFKCRKTGATVGCCNKKCRRSYHFPCGSESRMLNQYFGAFESFCINHHPTQKVPTVKNHSPICIICYEEVSIAKPSYDVLWAPCCKKQAWFHRDCIQKLALSAGYFFKCPVCSDAELFTNEMKRMGIHVPDQDASWELEPDAFKELLYKHNKCDHPTCICPERRTRNDDNGRHWNLIICSSCGSKGLHIGCGKLGSHTKKWECDGCRRIVGKRSSIHNHRNLVSNCLEAPSSSAVVSQKNRMVAHKRPYPDEEEEGHRSSTSNSCRDENDTGSEVEIIDIIPAQDSSSRPKYPRINSVPTSEPGNEPLFIMCTAATIQPPQVLFHERSRNSHAGHSDFTSFSSENNATSSVPQVFQADGVGRLANIPLLLRSEGGSNGPSTLSSSSQQLTPPTEFLNKPYSSLISTASSIASSSNTKQLEPINRGKQQQKMSPMVSSSTRIIDLNNDKSPDRPTQPTFPRRIGVLRRDGTSTPVLYLPYLLIRLPTRTNQTGILPSAGYNTQQHVELIRKVRHLNPIAMDVPTAQITQDERRATQTFSRREQGRSETEAIREQHQHRRINELEQREQVQPDADLEREKQAKRQAVEHNYSIRQSLWLRRQPQMDLKSTPSSSRHHPPSSSGGPIRSAPLRASQQTLMMPVNTQRIGNSQRDQRNRTRFMTVYNVVVDRDRDSRGGKSEAFIRQTGGQVHPPHLSSNVAPSFSNQYVSLSHQTAPSSSSSNPPSLYQ